MHAKSPEVGYDGTLQVRGFPDRLMERLREVLFCGTEPIITYKCTQAPSEALLDVLHARLQSLAAADAQQQDSHYTNLDLLSLPP